jgi:hypothetical protein
LEKKLINIQYIKPGALSIILLLTTVMLTTIDGSQNSVQAQTSTLLPSQLPPQDSTSTPATPATPAAESSGGSSLGSNSESSDSSESVDNNDLQDTSSSGDSNNAPITPAPATSDSNNDSTSGDNDGSDGNEENSNNDDSQNASSSDDEEADETEDNVKETNPLLQQIRQRVNSALSATGMAVP